MSKIDGDMFTGKFTTCELRIRTMKLWHYGHVPTMAAHMIGSVGVKHADIARQETKDRSGKMARSKPDTRDYSDNFTISIRSKD